jgi:bacteriorhodopsin
MMWYAARPVASVVMGVMVYVLIRAGLLVLEASDQESSTQYGYYAVSFLAGLNVDNFIKKFESVAGAAFGVNMSRASRPDDD